MPFPAVFQIMPFPDGTDARGRNVDILFAQLFAGTLLTMRRIFVGISNDTTLYIFGNAIFKIWFTMTILKQRLFTVNSHEALVIVKSSP